MSSEHKPLKTSLFRRAIERFSFRKKSTTKTKNGIKTELASADGKVISDKDQVPNNKLEIFSQPGPNNDIEHDTQPLSINKFSKECETKVSTISSENATVVNHKNSEKSPLNMDQDAKQAFIHQDNNKQDPLLNSAILSEPPTPTWPDVPSSARSYQPLHISQLDAALHRFKTTTALSRENISSSRPDISQHFQRTRSLGPTER